MNEFYAPDFSVKIEGLTLAADVRHAVTSLSYDSNRDAADMFTLQLNNGDLRWTDSALFDVGKRVEIYMGYAGALEPMILGEITAVSPSFPESGAPMLTVTGYDKSHRLRHNQPPGTSFKAMDDSLIVTQIAAENLLIPVVSPVPMPPRASVQQTGSDWALLQELADRNGFDVYVHWDKLYFKPPVQSELTVLEWGKNLSSFTPRLSTSGQYGLQIIRGYDYQLAQEIVAILPTLSLGGDLDEIIERLGSAFVDQLVNLGRYVIRDQPVRNFMEATVLAKSILQQLLQGLYEGSGSCIGLPHLRARHWVEIQGLGRRFSGKYTLSRVTHTIDQGGYRTTFEISQKNGSTLLQSLRKKIRETPSPTAQEKVNEVVIGKVVNNVDPEGLGRVQLRFPYLSAANVSAWARIATMMAGGTPTNSWGAYFLPDVGDEVLVVFERGNIDAPVVLGSLWNGKARPPAVNDGPNAKKLIKTKSGMQIILDDTPHSEQIIIKHQSGSTIKLEADGMVSIEAQGNFGLTANNAGNTITLDSRGITVSDKNGNGIIMGVGGIQVGSSSAAEPFVLGTQFLAKVTSFLAALSTHTHVGNMGAPTSPPTSPMILEVPLSLKNKVE